VNAFATFETEQGLKFKQTFEVYSQRFQREDFDEDAIVDRAASIILVHNHPSGDTEPSQEDVVITKRLVQAGEILGVKIHDHIIVSKNGYTSMKERGVI
jgi:DNA repair protein RadC